VRKIIPILGLLTIALLLPGCAERNLQQEMRSELQGTWIGQQVGKKGDWIIKFSEKKIHVATPVPGLEYNGVYVMVEGGPYPAFDFIISDMPQLLSHLNGEVSRAIYKIEDNTMTLAGNPPGVVEQPSSFQQTQSNVVLILNRKN
jgi:hypothetical protein